MSAIRVAIALVAFAPAGTAGAQTIELTSTTGFNWHTENDDGDEFNDDYGEGIERFNLSGRWNDFSSALRVDITTFHSEPTDPCLFDCPIELENRYENQLVLEKAWVAWTQRDIEVRAGDSYASVGRGLALSIRKVDELGVDTTLRGAKVLVHSGNLTAMATAGYANINNVDEATGRVTDDPFDLVAAVETKYRFADKLTLGAHGASAIFHEPVMDVLGDGYTYDDRWFSYGPTIDVPRLTDEFGFYLEGIGQYRQPGTDDPASKGYGLYGSATYRRGRATVLFEGKAYGNLELIKPKIEEAEFATVQYNSPPTLERVTQVIDHQQQDVVGGRLRFDWRASTNLLLFANYGLIRDYHDYSVEIAPMMIEGVPATIHDPYTGGELRWDNFRSRARVTTGYRLAVADETSDIVRGDAHFELDAVQALSPHWSLELHVVHLERRKLLAPIIDEKFREGTTQLGLRWSPKLSVGGVYDYTTREDQPKVHYFGGVTEYRPTQKVLLRLYAGASRGGLKCVSGVCREFPPFEGAKLTATVRY